MHLLLLFLLILWLSAAFPSAQSIPSTSAKRSAAIMGPKAARGLERGSLTVQCQYGPGYKNYVKWWCRGADWGRCKFVVKTTGSEKVVKKDRVSIKDNQKNRSFTVTMEKLRLNDADTYWCGIERIGIDLGVQIEVTVDPAPVTTGDTRGHPSNGGSVFMNLSVLIPLVFAVLLFLLVVASLVAWRMMKRQKKAAGMSAEQVLQPLESDICYANLSLQQTGNSSVSSRKKASRSSSSSAQANQVEVEYVTMAPPRPPPSVAQPPASLSNPEDISLQAPSPREHIAYAALSLDTLDQEPTYSNTGYLSTHVPSRSHEEPTEYSTIRKP
ncbi:CMRF35-like molecule 1 isoform X6 [Camelus bactrianus]|uniref:CMRF35-like molecule 1 isoform X6 n=1 Tax=Camelus bactrianus TaxID=9837 RepID=A0AC58NPN5_CAMBA